MEIFAGHPRIRLLHGRHRGYLRCWCLPGARRRWLVLAGVAGMFLGAAALAAVQLLPGWDASRESVRSAGLPYADAASLSFPPENLITLLVPGFFGDIEQTSYWGRWYLWEICLFISVTGWSWRSTAGPAASAAAPLRRADGAAAAAVGVGQLHAALPLPVLLLSRFQQLPHPFQVPFLCGRVPDDALRRGLGPAAPPASATTPVGGDCCRPCPAAGIGGCDGALRWPERRPRGGRSGRRHGGDAARAFCPGNSTRVPTCSSLRRVCRPKAY